MPTIHTANFWLKLDMHNLFCFFILVISPTKISPVVVCHNFGQFSRSSAPSYDGAAHQQWAPIGFPSWSKTPLTGVCLKMNGLSDGIAPDSSNIVRLLGNRIILELFMASFTYTFYSTINLQQFYFLCVSAVKPDELKRNGIGCVHWTPLLVVLQYSRYFSQIPY